MKKKKQLHLDFYHCGCQYCVKHKSNQLHSVKDMLFKIENLKAKMSIKIHYLFSHLDRFFENLEELSKEQGERFHQGIKVMEESYQENGTLT